MRAVIIENGVVANIIEVESLDVIPGLIEAGNAKIGDLYENGVFTTPPQSVEIPKSVTRFQGLAALEMAGKLTTLEAMMADPGTPRLTRLAFENALVFERNSPTVNTLAAALGLSEEDIDQLFLTAASITA